MLPGRHGQLRRRAVRGRQAARDAAAGGAARPGPRAVAEGHRFIGRSQVIGGAFLADLAATVFALPVALFPAINAERFGGDPRTLGLFTTAIGVGGLVSAAFSGPVRHSSRQGRAMLVTVAVWGAAFAGFAVVPGLWLTLALLAVAGAADAFTVVFRGAIVAAATPDRLRGRVMAADYVVGAGGGQLGNLEAGALASLTTPGSARCGRPGHGRRRPGDRPGAARLHPVPQRRGAPAARGAGAGRRRPGLTLTSRQQPPDQHDDHGQRGGEDVPARPPVGALLDRAGSRPVPGQGHAVTGQDPAHQHRDGFVHAPRRPSPRPCGRSRSP